MIAPHLYFPPYTDCPLFFLGSSPKIYELFLRVRVRVRVSLSGTALPYFSELPLAPHSSRSAEVNKATAPENSQIHPEAEATEPFQWRPLICGTAHLFTAEP